MANYLLAYTGGSTPETEEARDAQMAAWGKWFQDLGEAVVDPGNPFGPSKAIAADGSVGDGASSGLTGYSVLAADSLAMAEHAASHGLIGRAALAEMRREHGQAGKATVIAVDEPAQVAEALDRGAPAEPTPSVTVERCCARPSQPAGASVSAYRDCSKRCCSRRSACRDSIRTFSQPTLQLSSFSDIGFSV